MKCVRVIGLLLCVAPIAAVAIPIQSSVGTFVTARDCISGPNGPCEFLSSIVFSEYAGAPGDLSTAASIAIDGYGVAQSTIGLSGEVGAPQIGTSAFSDPAGRVNTNSFALQRYTYTGSVSTTRTFGGTLTYAQSIVDPNNDLYGGAASGINSQFLLFTSSDDFAEAGETPQSNNDDLFTFAHGGAAGYGLLGEDLYNDLSLDVLAGMANLGVTVNLNPGDDFWVYVFLQTPAGNGSFVDAFGTLLTGWDDTSNLVPANVTAVPEPGSLSLFSIGLGALLAVMYRRRFWSFRFGSARLVAH